jgi:hypothetical protein
VATPGFDAYALQTLRMTADVVQCQARHQLLIAIVKGDAAIEHLSNHSHHIVCFEGNPLMSVTHASSSAIGHLEILKVIFRPWKQVVVAAVVVVQVADDDVLHLLGIHANRGQALGDRLDDDATALGRHRMVEAGVHDERAVRAADYPDEIGQRLEEVVRIAADVVLVRLPIVMAIPDGEHLVEIALL